MPRNPLPSLTYLGRSTPAPTTPDEAVLDRVPNPHDDAPYVVRFSAPEFTVLCAVTRQPDFAHIVIDYVPKVWLIESKSLKFYLASFRNHSGFHEECTIEIGKRLAAVLEPAYLRIGGYWYPVEANRCVLGNGSVANQRMVTRAGDRYLSGPRITSREVQQATLSICSGCFARCENPAFTHG
jgi:7-cyano-7-deazaguanine reductase